ncbi:hypothetical protein [Tistrella mobilis]|uniref:Uncharacterized protein n=1 Tax=Tistrella mobilis (strain KA081020-065) TaxID=1110502 RepID=I3TL59_TISMK|nr:hypothetical protein [Tistrella mobilis]AFK53497.1 hypothetical protein TMO_1658 [Tistrella mobilis KA081020-065]
MDTSSSHDQIAKKLQDMGAMLEMQTRKLHDDGNEGGALSRDQQELHDAYRALKTRLEDGVRDLAAFDREVDRLEERVTAWMGQVETRPASRPSRS